MSQVAHEVGSYSHFCSITKSISTTPLPSPPDGMLVHRMVTCTVPHNIKFDSTYLSTWVERGSES